MPFIFVIFEWNCDILEEFLKSNTICNFTDIRPVGTDLLPIAEERTNGRTEKHGEFKSHLSQNWDRARKKGI